MINWDCIDTVLLDMDGTLLDLHFDNYFWNSYLPKRYAQVHGHREEDARSLLMSRFEAHEGTLEWYSVDYWSEQLQLDVPGLKHEIKHLISVRPFVEEFLRSLREHGKALYLVTNAHRQSLDIKMACTGLDRWFDAVVVSHDLRLPKENPEFWPALNQLHPFNPQRTLLIDDAEPVLNSAQFHGIAHLLTLLQPDSRRQRRLDTRFPGIHHFDEIMPLVPEPF